MVCYDTGSSDAMGMSVQRYARPWGKLLIRWTISGDTFRYRPDSVLVNTPTAYKTIFSASGNMKKAVFYEVYPRNVETVTAWNTTDVAVHARKRRVLNSALSDKAVRSAEPFVQAHSDRWCELLAGQVAEGGGKGDGACSQPLNMADWANYFVFDVLGDLCFGKSFDLKEPGNNLRYIPQLMCDFVEMMYPVSDE